MNKPVLVGIVALLILAGLTGAGPLPAWELDKLAETDYFYLPESDLKNEEGKIEMSSYQAWGVIPLQISDGAILLTGAGYRGLYLNYPDLNFAYPLPEGGTFTEKDLPRDLHAVTLILGGLLDLGEGWGLFVDFRPGLQSDLNEINSKDLSYQGAGLVSYIFSENLTGFLGLYYTDSFSRPQLLPLGGVQWRISDSFTLDTLLPEYLLLSYQSSPRWKIGLRGRVRGDEFRLSENTPWNNTVLQYSRITLGPYADYYLTDHLVLRLEGGVVTARTFKFRDDDSPSRLYDGDIEDGGFIGASLFFEY